MLRWDYNIKMDLNRNKLLVCGLDSFNLGQELLSGSCEYGNTLSVSKKGREKFLTS